MSRAPFNVARPYAMMQAIMGYWLFPCLAIACYLIGAGALLQRLRRGEGPTRLTRGIVLPTVLFAALLHAGVLYDALRMDDALNLGLANAVALVAWAVVALYLLTALYRPIDNLGIFVLPAAALAIVLAWLAPGRPVLLPATSPIEVAHVVISVVAYGLLTLAAVQGLLLLLQERELRRRQAGMLLRALPPLETMEQLLFQLIGVGFLLLTLTLVSGVLFSEELFGKPLRFTHHMVLSVLAWLVFAALLLGHWRLGWRGRPAARWALGGFVLLVLAYFGTKFVLEVILGR